MIKSNKKPLSQSSRQQGKVSLQNVFWVVGIIVGLLSIAQFVLTYLDGRYSDGMNEASQNNTSTNAAAPNDMNEPKDANETIGALPKSPLFDSPSSKIDNYTAYDNGVVIDEAMGIMWMRCSLGQEWNGSDCAGTANAYSMEEAKLALEQLNTVSYVGLTEWQLPDIAALHSLIYCSEGYENSVEVPLRTGERKEVEVDCAGSYIKPTIRGSVFPNTQWAIWRGYWSSSQNDAGEPLVVYFNNGKIEAKNKSHYVRAMRYIDAN